MSESRAGLEPCTEQELWANLKAERANTDALKAQLAARTAEAAALREALVAVVPEGWANDDTMDHMPGIKRAREALTSTPDRITGLVEAATSLERWTKEQETGPDDGEGEHEFIERTLTDAFEIGKRAGTALAKYRGAT